MQQCSLILWLHNTTSCTCAAEQQHRVAAGSEQHASHAVGKLSSISLACRSPNTKQTLHLTSVICQIICQDICQDICWTLVDTQIKKLAYLPIYSLLLLTKALFWQKTMRWNTPLYNLTKNTNTFTFFSGWDFIMTHLVRIDKGPVMDWTNDIGLGERYRKWKKRVEVLFKGPLNTVCRRS